MDSASIVAYIGAAAWLPQIAMWTYIYISKPRVRIITDPKIQIGFTNDGPSLLIRFAMLVDNKDAIIDKLTVSLVHEDGDHHSFVWMNMNESLAQYSNLSGERILAEKNDTPIVLKAERSGVCDKRVYFSDVDFKERYAKLAHTAIDHFHFLRNTTGEYQRQFEQSKELHELLNFSKSSFWWKPGSYTLTFNISSLNGAVLRRSQVTFVVSQVDVDALAINKELIATVHHNWIYSEQQLKPVDFNYRYPSVRSTV